MKTEPVVNPRQLTPAFDYAFSFLNYVWVNSIDENGVQSKSLAPPVFRHVGRIHPDVLAAPLYQVHELPVLEKL